MGEALRLLAAHAASEAMPQTDEADADLLELVGSLTRVEGRETGFWTMCHQPADERRAWSEFEPTSRIEKDADRSMRTLRMCIILLVCGATSAWAQGEPSGIPWSQLSPGEQQLLQRFSETWDQLPPRKQQRLRNGARQWGTMTPEERREARQRFKEWRTLPPEQQQQLRDRFQQYRQLPPEQRESVKNARRWFKSLPPEERQALREKFQSMSPEERRAYRRELRRQHGGTGAGQAPSDQPTGQRSE